MRLYLAILSALALASLVPRAARVELAGGDAGNVGRVMARQEALHANIGIHMSRRAQWLTPEFMDRYPLYQPPLPYWLSAAAARIFGISTLALRLPVAVVAALAAALLFLWAAELGGWPAGMLAFALLVSNHLWHLLSGMALMDGLFAAFSLAALYALFADPWLESKAALWGFCGATAASMLTAGIAGLLPLGALGLYWMAAPPRYRPGRARVAAAAALAAALAAPWFAYQLAAHRKWFILDYAADLPLQASAESAALFYSMRLALTDPMLLAAALVAIPAFLAALRKRTAAAVLLACWLVAAALAVFGAPHRSIACLLPMVPALALLASAYGPLTQRTPPWALLALALALVAAKAATPNAPWGLSFAQAAQPLAPLLQDYCHSARDNELIVVGLDDDLYASALPLPRLRYALVDAPPAAGAPAAFLGVSSAAELSELVRALPQSDFLIPGRYRAAADAAHRLVEAFPDHCFLLARASAPRPQPPAWTCRM
ncbi:MAG TPA: glycosyltransferase family 39 protein [Bryobacteraceae bacterium]|nr:glycosyltransferase family 39 protein [Bryobacteraceae bacterium]